MKTIKLGSRKSTSKPKMRAFMECPEDEILENYYINHDKRIKGVNIIGSNIDKQFELPKKLDFTGLGSTFAKKTKTNYK